MEEFVLNIDHGKFQSTNAAWNELMLNDPWSVGYVTSIIEYKTFSRKEEWEELYYRTGAYRNALIEEHHQEYKEILNDESLIRIATEKMLALPNPIRAVNNAHGRTKEEFRKKAQILQEFMRSRGSTISEEECVECVRFRTICETWNGVIVREKNTIKTLQTLFPTYTFRKVPGEMDHRYAVDYEVLQEDHLLLALQIKPPSYTRNAPYIIKARKANKKKNAAYTDHYGVNVVDVIASSLGDIDNLKEVKAFIPV